MTEGCKKRYNLSVKKRSRKEVKEMAKRNRKTRVQKEGKKWLKQSMTKKALKEYYKRDRNRALFDTSTKTFKSKRDYDRKAEKNKAREAKRGADE